MNVQLRISGLMYESLKSHLYSGDGRESLAIALCGSLKSKHSTILLVHKIIPIPLDDCIIRSESQITWRTHKLIEVLPLADQKKFSILKIHSHPTGYPEFSETDDFADAELFNSISSWVEDVEYHSSAIMLPDGKIFGRAIKAGVISNSLDKVTIVGDDIKFFLEDDFAPIADFNIRTAQAFGNATTTLLKKLTAGIIGCSGTGSPTIEQLVRLGFGKVVIVDPDKIEKKNLNRILNSKMDDAVQQRYKVYVLKNAIDSIGLGTQVVAYPQNLYDSKDVLQEIASCDVLFGCMDSIDGRQLLNQLATFYLVPYFDLGVKLIADGKGNIDQIWATIHYLQPGKSSLLTRGVYSHDDLNAASMLRTNPSQYEGLKKEGYIKNVNVESPAVISINMSISSMSVIEFLARIHKFRYDDNAESAVTRISFTDSYIQKEPEGVYDIYLQKFVGRGDITPFLNMHELS